MTIISTFRSAASYTYATNSLIPGDLAVVGLWSLLGLGISVALVMSGLAGDIGAVLALAG